MRERVSEQSVQRGGRRQVLRGRVSTAVHGRQLELVLQALHGPLSGTLFALGPGGVRVDDQQGGPRGLRGRVRGSGARGRNHSGRVGVQAPPASGRGEEDAAHSAVLTKGTSAERGGEAGKEGCQDSHVLEPVHNLNFF